MDKNLTGLLIGLIFAVSLSAQASVIVYDNTTSGFDAGISSITALQQGDQVTLAGTSRIITELLIGVTRQGLPGSADMQVRMFENDGAGGQPGTLLWDSGLFDDVALAGGPELISFSVPHILVPDTFTWTIQFSDSQGPQSAEVGLPLGFPPTVGTFEKSWFGFGGTTADVHVSRVIAPEPTTVALLGLGLTGLGYRRHRSKKAA